MNINENFNDIQNSEKTELVAEIRYYLFFWPWFVFSIIVLIVSAFIFLRYSSTIYTTTAQLQVKDSQSDPSTFLSRSASAMFSFDRVKIDNHIAQITSIPNYIKLVEKLDLQTQIYEVGRIKNTLKFQDEIPFIINFKNDNIYKDGILLRISGANSSVDVLDKSYSFDIKNNYFECDEFSLNFNKIIKEDIDYLIRRFDKKLIVSSVEESIEVNPSTLEGDNIDLSIKGSNIMRNEEILNTLIEIAHDDQIFEKQRIYNLSIEFINTRLSYIINEIDSLSVKTTGFKSSNLIFSPEAQTSNALINLSELEQDELNLTTQLELARALQQNLKDQSDFSLLPSNIGLNSGNVNELVLAYNNLVLDRNNLLSGATERNPLTIRLSEQLTDLKQNILISIDNYLKNLETSLENFIKFRDNTSSQVAQIPKLEAELSTFQRKFQIAENLYLFLLERREEASISLQSTLPSTRIINFANTNPLNISPSQRIVYLVALIIGLLLPFTVLFTLKILDNKFHTREDLIELMPDIDILGEVPFIEESENNLMDSRGVFAESSRVIRSNIAYKLRVDESSKVILLTSSIKGEGKTLTVFNLACSYAQIGKKVILLGADLRNPQLHRFTSAKRKDYSVGLSSILVNPSLSYKNLTQKFEMHNYSIDLLNSGPIPPNPAELLGSDTFENLIEDLKKNYDIILIDSAPLLLVSDTLPILKFADLILLNVRSGYTDKNIAKFINETVKTKNLKNVGLILNAIKAGANSYIKYGYSYRYSYAYKYNYGYGYGYSRDK